MMDTTLDDPTAPLLGYRANYNSRRNNYSNYFRECISWQCSGRSWRRRIPILKWWSTYNSTFLLQDALAGITVGLTSIPQGIAYAIIAGLPPQYGLYSSMFPGVVYMVFGSCKDVTVGPTAILAALVSKYVLYSADLAILAAFLSGCFMFLLGVLHLGFLLDFISKPVISGFTTAAALQIAATQLKSLFRVSGSSGGTFVQALIHFFKNITEVKLWDPLLGFSTIAVLLLIKKSNVSTCSSGILVVWRTIVRARNAAVVALGATLAYCLHCYAELQPFALTGEIHGGLPHFAPPPFSTVVNNQTYNFSDMMDVFNAEGLVMPLVAILETIAIAKAFAGNNRVDASQEMVAVGLCNIVSSFCQSMPVTGSFTRTALNHDSGVATTAGGLFKGALVLLSVTYLSPTFAWIPRATLAAVIMVAMLSIISFSIMPLLWRHSKLELLVFSITVLIGISAGLEYGILSGVLVDLLRLLYFSARPKFLVNKFKISHYDCVSILLQGNLSYCCAEYFGDKILKAVGDSRLCLLLDGRHLHSVDLSVAENLVGLVQDLEGKGNFVLLWHFLPGVQKVLEEIQPSLVEKFTEVLELDDSFINTFTGNSNIAFR